MYKHPLIFELKHKCRYKELIVLKKLTTLNSVFNVHFNVYCFRVRLLSVLRVHSDVSSMTSDFEEFPSQISSIFSYLNSWERFRFSV